MCGGRHLGHQRAIPCICKPLSVSRERLLPRRHRVSDGVVARVRRQPPFCWPFRSPTRSACRLGLIVGHPAGRASARLAGNVVIEALPALLLAPLLRRLLPDNPHGQAGSPLECAELVGPADRDSPPRPVGRVERLGSVLFAVVYGACIFALWRVAVLSAPNLVASLAHGTATRRPLPRWRPQPWCGLEPPQHRPLGRPSGPYHTANNGRH